jgi:4-amino-4-deoxy-L-arabinose transferase-like glycosyltransferase
MSSPAARRTLRIAFWIAIVAFGLSRFLWLASDFPNDSQWMVDQAKFTDEGWWGNAAVMHALTGHWHIAGDYNPAAALPVWPMLLAGLFHFTGVSIIAARALNVFFSLATLAVVYLLVRSHAQSRIAAETAVLLMAASPFAFVFCRLAILDTLVIFEFCLALLLASRHAIAPGRGKQRLWPFAALTLLITAALLTKTTSAVLIPAIAWMAFYSARRGQARVSVALFHVLIATVAAPLALLKLWSLFVSWLGYGVDYKFFFTVNALQDIEWPQTLHWMHDLALNGHWIDRLLYPAALVILLASVIVRRSLWRNPLFAASWLAIAGEAAFILHCQDDYAPRYFLVMLAPVVFIVALAFDEALRSSRRAIRAVPEILVIASVCANAVTIAGFLTHRQYQLYGAAEDIAAHIRADSTRNQLVFGVSAAQIGIIERLPSLNGAYGIDDMPAKLARYKPDWYLAWNDEVDYDAMRGYTLTPVASYRIFDDDGRTVLTLYKLKAANSQ